MAQDFEKDLATVAGVKAIPTMLDIVCRTTGLRFAAVARVTETRWIACSVRDEMGFGLTPGGELDVATTICHEIRQSGRPVVIDHASKDPLYCAHLTPRIYGLQSYISVPIRRLDGSFFGTLCALDPEPRRLSAPETIEMFEMFADVIGFHLSMIDRMDLAEACLLDERQTAALREQFIAVLGHDLRNPLSGIVGGMAILRKTPLNDKAQTIVGLIEKSAARMAGLIDNILDFARGRLGGGIVLERDDEPLEPVLRQVVAELQTGSPDRIIETRFDFDVPVSSDRRRMAQLASNLLGNAISHGAPDEPIIFEAAARGGVFRLAVANRGAPITPEVMKQIFKPFSRGEVRSSMQGLGLGLYIAHEIASAHGGELDVASTPAETRFTFRMPLSGRPLNRLSRRATD